MSFMLATLQADRDTSNAPHLAWPKTELALEQILHPKAISYLPKPTRSIPEIKTLNTLSLVTLDA